MKTPDKIYISPNIENRTWLIGKADTTNIEYIRKDAILDKLKTQRDKCVYRSTYWDFYQAIITEIKAL